MLSASPLEAQVFYTLKGHGGPIMDIAVSQTGQVATASFDNSVGLWQNTVPQWLEGHRAAVNTVQFVSDTVLASGGDDFKLYLWSLETRRGQEAAAHTAKITDIATTPQSDLIASSSWDSTIKLTVLGPDDPQELHGKTLSGHKSGVNAVAFSPGDQTLYSASVDGTIRKWRYTQAQVTSTVIIKHGFGVNELIVNDRDGWLAYGATDGGTRIVDLSTGKQIADFTLERRPILAMAYDPQGRTLAVGDGQGFIMLVDTEKMRITHDFQASQNGPIWALAFSRGGQNLHAGGIEDIVYSWPVDTITQHGPMAGTPRSFLKKPATMTNGERQFKRKCSICHALGQSSARKAGPSLFGLFGRKAGTMHDYAYSATLDGSDIIWSAQTIDALFDLGPDHYIPGTKMPMQRIAKQSDRDDLIDYLRAHTAHGKE
ncbi:MAG: c-type cytochrome [Sulfitobacter sp.]